MAVTPTTHAPAPGLSSFASSSTSTSISTSTSNSKSEMASTNVDDVNFHADEDVDARLGRSWAAKEAEARWARDSDGHGYSGGRERRREGEDTDDADGGDGGAFRLAGDGYRGRDRKIRIGIGGDEDEDEEEEILSVPVPGIDGEQNGRRILQTEDDAPTGIISKAGSNAPALPGIRDMFPDHLFEQQALEARIVGERQKQVHGGIRPDAFAFGLRSGASGINLRSLHPTTTSFPAPSTLAQHPAPSFLHAPQGSGLISFTAPSSVDRDTATAINTASMRMEDHGEYEREARPHASPLTALTALTAQTSLTAAATQMSAAGRPVQATNGAVPVPMRVQIRDDRARLDAYSFPRTPVSGTGGRIGSGFGSGSGRGPSPSPTWAKNRTSAHPRSTVERESLGTTAAAAGLLGLSLSGGVSTSSATVTPVPPLSASVRSPLVRPADATTRSGAIKGDKDADAMDVDDNDNEAKIDTMDAHRHGHGHAHHDVSLSLSSAASVPSFAATFSHSSITSVSTSASELGLEDEGDDEDEEDAEEDEDELEEDELIASDGEDDAGAHHAPTTIKKLRVRSKPRMLLRRGGAGGTRRRFMRGSSDGSASARTSGSTSAAGEMMTTTAPTSVDSHVSAAELGLMRTKVAMRGVPAGLGAGAAGVDTGVALAVSKAGSKSDRDGDGEAPDQVAKQKAVADASLGNENENENENENGDEVEDGVAAGEGGTDGASGPGAGAAGTGTGTGAGAARNWKRHTCPHCRKRFNRPSSLKIHLNTHTGEKPFECPFPGCGRQFNVSSNMRRHYRNHQTVATGVPPVPIPMGPPGSLARPVYSGSIPPGHGHVAPPPPHAYGAGGYDRMRMRTSSETLGLYPRAHPVPAVGNAPPSAYRGAPGVGVSPAEYAAARQRGPHMSTPPPPGYDLYAGPGPSYVDRERLEKERQQHYARAEMEFERERDRMDRGGHYPPPPPGSYPRPVHYYPIHGSPDRNTLQLEYGAASRTDRTRSGQGYAYPYPPPPPSHSSGSHLYTQSVPHALPPHERSSRYALPPPTHSVSPQSGRAPPLPTDWSSQSQRGHVHSQSAPVAFPYAREKQLRALPSTIAAGSASSSAAGVKLPPIVRERRDSLVANTGHESETELANGRRRESEDIDMGDDVDVAENLRRSSKSSASPDADVLNSKQSASARGHLSGDMGRSPGSMSASAVPMSAHAHRSSSPQLQYAKVESSRSPVSSPALSARSKSHSQSQSYSHTYSHSHSHSLSYGTSSPYGSAVPPGAPAPVGRERGLSHSRAGSASSSGHGHGVHPYARPPGVRHAHSLSRDMNMKERGLLDRDRELPPLPPLPPTAQSGPGAVSPYASQSRAPYAAITPPSSEDANRR